MRDKIVVARVKDEVGTAVNKLMGTRLAVSGYIGIVAYCVLSLFWGPMGIKAYSELESRVGQMKDNLASLETLHGEALANLESARSDPETLALQARSLGYVTEGEVVVRVGFPESGSQPRDLGALVPYVAPKGRDDTELKTISMVAALCAFFISLLVRAPKAAPGRAKEKQGTRARAPRIRSVPKTGAV